MQEGDGDRPAGPGQIVGKLRRNGWKLCENALDWGPSRYLFRCTKGPHLMNKLATAALAASLVLGLAACGKSDSAKEEAAAQSVEMPAEEAVTDVNAAPVADASAGADAAAAPAEAAPATSAAPAKQ